MLVHATLMEYQVGLFADRITAVELTIHLFQYKTHSS